MVTGQNESVHFCFCFFINILRDAVTSVTTVTMKNSISVKEESGVVTSEPRKSFVLKGGVRRE